MEVRFSPELEAKIHDLAAAQGHDAEALVLEAVEHFVDYDRWFIREVEEGLAQIENGQVLSHDEVGHRLERRLSDKRFGA